MAARTLGLAAGGRARAAAAAAAAAAATRLLPSAPPLGRSFPCPAASSLLSPRAPPLLGPRGPGAPRLRPLAPMSFHPLAFSSASTAKGVEGQDPGEGGEKSKEAAARAVDAGAKKPDAASAAELSGKIRAHDDSPAGEIPKNQPPRTPATPPCPPAAGDRSNLSALDSGELPPGHVSGDPNPKSGDHAAAGDSIAGKKPVNPTADEYETIVKLFRAQCKENEENVLKGVERLLEVYSNMEEEGSRLGLNNQTKWILLGVFIEIVVVVAAGFIFLV